MSAERVVFSRIGERQGAYIDFFNQLQAKLIAIEALSIRPLTNQQGRHWIALSVGPTDSDSCKPPYVGFVFARRSRFRIEVYIDEGEQSQNKQVFDQLQAQKADIETEFGAVLSWERLNNRRASRIAYCRLNSSITNSPEELDSIRDWSVEMLPKFHAVLSDRFIAAQREVVHVGESESLEAEN